MVFSKMARPAFRPAAIALNRAIAKQAPALTTQQYHRFSSAAAAKAIIPPAELAKSCPKYTGGKMKMTTEEAFVLTLQKNGITDAFGIIGSAFMPISDMFPEAGIKFWDCAHEYNAGFMCDGYTRTTGRMSLMIAQNGPGISNFVTPVKTAYWNHTPLLLVTPQAANKTIGQGGFQEVEQMNMFKDCVCYQEEVRDPSRIPEVLTRVIEQAYRNSAPAQINIPRDYWTRVLEFEIPDRKELEPSPGGAKSLQAAAELLAGAEFPVILNGAGTILSEGGVDASRKLAERLSAPVCCNYQHNDAFPGNHPLYAGPLGYNGSKAGMALIEKADVVLALGTRLNPFSTLPGYGLNYWPQNAKLIQVDLNGDRIGLTKKVDVPIQGDAALVAEGIMNYLPATAGDSNRVKREETIKATKERWSSELKELKHEQDDPGTTWNERARSAHPERMSVRMGWSSVMKVLPKDAIISMDIGNNCAVGNAYPSFEKSRKYLSPGLYGPCGYGFPSILGAKVGNPSVPVVGFAGDGAFGISMNEMTACGRNDWPPITMVIWRNYQWGAEKRNTTLWYADNFVGTELNYGVEYAKVAEACNVKGVQVSTQEEFEKALIDAVDGQMNRNETTFIEVVLNQELGEPFRRDAMTMPVRYVQFDPKAANFLSSA